MKYIWTLFLYITTAFPDFVFFFVQFTFYTSTISVAAIIKTRCSTTATHYYDADDDGVDVLYLFILYFLLCIGFSLYKFIILLLQSLSLPCLLLCLCFLFFFCYYVEHPPTVPNCYPYLLLLCCVCCMCCYYLGCKRMHL